MKNEKSLKDTIYNAILEDMFSLEYKPGDILNEKVRLKSMTVVNRQSGKRF